MPKFTGSLLNLADKLKEVKYAGLTESYDRPVLAGVYFDSDKLAASDGLRLAVTKLHNRGKLNFILPIKAVAVILSLATPKMQVAVTKDRAIFKAKDMLIVCRTIQGQFPKYEQLIPTRGKKITFPTKLLKEAIRAALRLKGDKLVIESGRKGALITAKMETGAYYSSNQAASTFSATVPCRGRIRISLIGKQFLDMLDHVPTAEVVVRYEDQNKPILVKNNGSSHVLMPIMMPKKEVITPQSLGVPTPQSVAAAGPAAGGDFPEELDEE
jgi:DNA polymerase III sliding clamp (beta) subunit (PCNA family)